MGFNCGIIGLPNAGKSTIFNALTAQHVSAEAYPFCTTDHNKGIVNVPDERLDRIAAIFKPKKVVSTHVEFVDIAGLVKNAHVGEGLGNKFLHHISEVDAIAHVVRCFDNNNVAHVEGKIDPVNDIEIIETELMLSDLEKATRHLEKNIKTAKSGDKEIKRLIAVLERAKEDLENGTPLRKTPFIESEKEILRPLSLLSIKPVLYVANGNETDIKTPSNRIKAVEKYTGDNGYEFLVICGGIESELADLSKEEQIDFLKDLGLLETGLVRLIHAGYKLLDLITFFTKEGPEVRAWTVKSGTRAPQAAGKIHTDFEKGFIRADVFTYNELVGAGDEQVIKERGHLRSEGHEYIVQDGDIIQFKFNV